MKNFKDVISPKCKASISLPLSLSESFSARGNVCIDLINKETGEITRAYENHNLIVKSGRSMLINMLAGVSMFSVKKMKIGKGGADIINSPFVPISPLDGEVDLATPITTNTINSTATDLAGTNPKVTFVSLFDCEVVNSYVNECGLFFNDGPITMFARHTFPTVSLESTSGFTMQISWTIEF